MNIDFSPVLGVMREKARQGPVAFVLCDAYYGDLLRNWLQHARASGFGNIVVCALDAATVRQAKEAGEASALLDFQGAYGDLVAMRALLYAALCRENIDFIHSDADAIWLRNPVERLFGLDADLVFSQGTIWPHDIVADWGFVLCCGLFAVRASRASGDFFQAAALRAQQDRSDQASVNRALRTAGISWRRPEIRQEREWKGRPFFTFDQPVWGSTGALTVAMLPHAECFRLPEVSSGALVAHPIAPKEPKAKIVLLKELGLWS